LSLEDTPQPVSNRSRAPDATAAALILAGQASRPLPLAHPRILLLGDGVELGRAGASGSWSEQLEGSLLSRRHARVNRMPDGEYVVADLGSTNGTWLDGRRLDAGAAFRLNLGSILALGGYVFVFRRVTPDQLAALREDGACPFGPVPTLSPTMSVLVRKLNRMAPAAIDLLIDGETGVGKEVHALAIHRVSRRKGAFVAINCAAIPDNLVESELFGYARGAHSTADRGKEGLVQRAEGGTLFLDEIGEMSQPAQTKLLRLLQSREFVPLGTTQSRRLDVRVVAASNRRPASDVPGLVGLRDDLIARLGPEPLTLPPLRARPEDIGTLTTFLTDAATSFSPEAYHALFRHGWKGNVRELEKVLTLARVLAGAGAPIGLEHLPTAMAAGIDDRPLGVRALTRQRPTRGELAALLSRHGGDVAQLARELGRQRTLVWRWLRENQLSPNGFRS
jgi:DNA-binding NtrC family response regulator